MAVRAVAMASGWCGEVQFSAEDASRKEPEFLAEVVEAVIDAGAAVVNIPDTVGYTMPEEYYRLIFYLKSHVPNVDRARLSVHCHNDMGMAVANSLAAIRAGAQQVEGPSTASGNGPETLLWRKSSWRCVPGRTSFPAYRPAYGRRN